MKTTQTKIEELRDIIALDKYGKIYSALPDDGPEQDYVAGEADARAVHQACESGPMPVLSEDLLAKPGHTPAPWKKFWNGHYWEITAQPNPDREHSVYSPSVCLVFKSSSNEANADLIAAAPQLLAACETCDAMMTAIECGHQKPIGFGNAIDAARAAISAARGEK